MPGCCGEPSRVPSRYASVKCPRCSGTKVREISRGLSLAWYVCGTCGYEWQRGW